LNKIQVSVVIVNFNSLSLISDCVDSIIENCTSTDYEIIVVSNSDEDPSEINALKNKLPTITYLETGSNLGFAKANNIGAKKASGEYLFFLNPDTILINDVLDIQYKKINRSPEIGLIGPAVFNQNGNQEPSVVSHITTLSLISLAFPFINFFISKKKQGSFYSLDKSAFVDVVHGSCMFISAKLYQNVGGMNEDFFLYSEERDLCLKIEKAGFRVFFYYDAQINHIGGGTSKNLFLPLEIEKHRSKKKLIQLYYPHLVFLNKICGIIGYGIRTVVKVVSFNKFKARQFGTLFFWYLFKYK
jgi:GT2 family glycosyltransferase|tara:strand:- start:6077 stop:6979 length:903 start_codon:yes stop_codon:yes gene_type:complete